MRVLLTTDPVGGVWTFTKELATGLLEMDHSVALVSFGRALSPDQAAWCSAIGTDYDGRFRCNVSLAPLEWTPENETAYTAGASLLLQIADEFSSDILHTGQFCFGRLPVRIPKIITAHSDVLSWVAACRPGGLEASRGSNGTEPWFRMDSMGQTPW